MSDKLALPEWTMGQVLLPEQFLALQDTLLIHLHRRVELAGLPAHGLARLRWDERGLEAGMVSIQALTWVLPSGRLLDVPGNAVVGSFNFLEAAGGESRVPLYLHVLHRTVEGTDHSTYADDDPSVKRVLQQLELSLANEHDEARESHKLAELHRTEDGAWTTGPFSPPLLCLGPRVSPFLRDELRAQQTVIERLASELQERRTDAFRGQSQQSALPQAQVSAYRVQALLADLGAGDWSQEVWLHPYRLFTALRDFYLELTILQGLPLQPWPIRYEHLDLAGSFGRLRESISRYESQSRLLAPRLDFERKGHHFVTRRFPDELCRAEHVYLVIRPGGTNLDGVRLASPRRITEVVTRSLTGVRFSPLESDGLAFAYGYGRDVAFYELRTAEGERDEPKEWQLAVEERALCFDARAGFEGLRAALVWGR